MTRAMSSRCGKATRRCCPAPRAAAYGGLDRLIFKHQGFNPTGSFKDNGMTCGASQAMRLGMKRVACVSTGNTSASMAAYASAAGLQPIIFIPHGNISYGKLAQALEYGATTFQVEANFDQILALVRALAERLGIYLLNSINPFRIEGQKSIIVEMMDQRDWNPPDWIVLPGGNLGNTSAFGKALRELHALRLHLARCRAWPWCRPKVGAVLRPACSVSRPRASAPSSIRRRWRPPSRSATRSPGRKRCTRFAATDGVVEKVTEQEIADAKAIIGQCGIGCEPASAATLAGIRKLTAAGMIDKASDVVAVLTGNVLKDPDYIYRYHTDDLKAPDGSAIRANFGNQPIVVPNDEEKIAAMLTA